MHITKKQFYVSVFFEMYLILNSLDIFFINSNLHSPVNTIHSLLFTLQLLFQQKSIEMLIHKMGE